MTYWWVAIGIWFVVGVLVARFLVWKVGLDGSEEDEFLAIAMASVFWPLLLAFGGPCWLIYKAVTIPPRRVRMERKHTRLSDEIARLERDLNIAEGAVDAEAKKHLR